MEKWRRHPLRPVSLAALRQEILSLIVKLEKQDREQSQRSDVVSGHLRPLPVARAKHTKAA